MQEIGYEEEGGDTYPTVDGQFGNHSAEGSHPVGNTVTDGCEF